MASTSGADTKRELSRARGETVSWRQFRDEISDGSSSVRSRRIVAGGGSESDDRVA